MKSCAPAGVLVNDDRPALYVRRGHGSTLGEGMGPLHAVQGESTWDSNNGAAKSYGVADPRIRTTRP